MKCKIKNNSDVMLIYNKKFSVSPLTTHISVKNINKRISIKKIVNKSIIINKGSNSGIKMGMPVLSKGNLVGRIVEVNYLSSRILLLNDLNSRIPVVISPTGDQAILTGAGREKPVLDYLPENFKFNEESLVYTSGKDGVLFTGIPME